jgi:hypothetical protein
MTLAFSLHLKLITLFALLVAISFGIYFGVSGNVPIGGQLLTNSSFVQGELGWDAKVDEQLGRIETAQNLVSLYSYKKASSVNIGQAVGMDKISNQVILSAKIKTADISQGEFGWNQGRLILKQYVNKKPVYSLPHVLINLNGTHDWNTYSRTFAIDPRTEYIAVALQISKATGELHCKDIELYNAIPNPLYTKLRIALMGGWGIFCVLLIWPYLRKNSILSSLLITAVAVILVFGITMMQTLKVIFEGR